MAKATPFRAKEADKPDEHAHLLNRMHSGDWEAFSSFFRSYSERLYLYAVGFLDNREDARDIVQNCFTYIWEHRTKLPASGSLYSYMLRMVKNDCLDFRMHKKVQEKYAQTIGNSSEAFEEDDDDFDLLYNRLRKTVEALPEKCREIFILGCVEGFSYKEVAEKSGVSVNTVKSQIKIAYKKVKSELNENQLKTLLFFMPL